MTRLHRALGLTLALITTVSLTAFGTAANAQPASDIASHQAQPASGSLLANIDDRSQTYVGRLPPSFHAVEGRDKVNQIGELTWYSTDEAVAKYGEAGVRRSIVRGIHACGRIAIQRAALAQLSAQTDEAAASQEANKHGRKAAQAASALSTIAGGGLGFAFGPLYGGLNLLAGTIPSLLQQHTYAKTLNQNDIMIALSLAQSRYYVSQNDFYLDLVGDDYCPLLMDWVSRFGDVQPSGVMPPS